MKRIINYLTITIITTTHLAAQGEFKSALTGPPGEMTVKIFNLSAELDIIGHNSNEVIINGSGYRGVPEKAQGLKPLSAYGEDNTSIGLYFNISGNSVEISGASKAANDTDYEIRLPRNIKLRIESLSWSGEDIEVKGMQNEVDIKANSADVFLENITGPVVLNTMNGEVQVTFSNVGQSTPHSISATNGDIDISFPADSKADFRLSNINGEIYTDLDLKFEGEEGDLRRRGGGMRANPKLNGGGVEFSIHAINGNIYLRKSQ